MPPCSPRELDLLLHLVLSHHGRLEFGAAVEPMTLEAEILHYADNASAKSASMAEALRDPANFNGAGAIERADLAAGAAESLSRGRGILRPTAPRPESGTAA